MQRGRLAARTHENAMGLASHHGRGKANQGGRDKGGRKEEVTDATTEGTPRGPGSSRSRACSYLWRSAEIYRRAASPLPLHRPAAHVWPPGRVSLRRFVVRTPFQKYSWRHRAEKKMVHRNFKKKSLRKFHPAQPGPRTIAQGARAENLGVSWCSRK